MSPTLTGVHHLKFPAADLAATLAWFRTALGAERLPGFDHRDHDGVLFGVIVRLPGLDVPVELRQWPEAAAATAGYDPVTFAVADRAALEDWVRHFDAMRRGALARPGPASPVTSSTCAPRTAWRSGCTRGCRTTPRRSTWTRRTPTSAARGSASESTVDGFGG